MSDRDVELLALQRTILSGGIAVSTRMVLDRLDKLQRDLDRMAMTQGDLIRTCHSLHCRLTQLSVAHVPETDAQPQG